MKNQMVNGLITLSESIGGEGNYSYEANTTRSLWRAVITQALIDASSGSKKKSHKFAQRQALKWLRGRSKGFFLVCSLAEMDPNYVITQSRKALNRGCKWRQDKKSHQPVKY